MAKARQVGEAALRRLLLIAQRDTHQSRVVAKFLLGLYNGSNFPVNLTDFRRLDHSIFLDCLRVLQMDWSPAYEVHEYFEQGDKIWRELAQS